MTDADILIKALPGAGEGAVHGVVMVDGVVHRVEHVVPEQYAIEHCTGYCRIANSGTSVFGLKLSTERGGAFTVIKEAIVLRASATLHVRDAPK